MSNHIENQYISDYVSPPGETLLEILEERGMTQTDLAHRMGRPKKTINEIIKSKISITPETAIQFENVLNIPASFWNNREKQYREFLSKREEKLRLKDKIAWLKEFPIKEMIKKRWICQCGDKVDQLSNLLKFFGIASPEQWDIVWERFSETFCRSSVFETNRKALSAWLRQGEIEAQEIRCNPYEASVFKGILNDIRKLTTATPDVFQPQLVHLCAQAGIAVVFLPELPKIRISGATYWLTPDKALVLLSLRYKTDDQLWFTFFHEAGHIILHNKKRIFLEDETAHTEKEEKEANDFATNFLIPSYEFEKFLRGLTIGRISKKEIRSFAQKIQIASGIVVGRLQHDHYLPYTHCNELKQIFKWT